MRSFCIDIVSSRAGPNPRRRDPGPDALTRRFEKTSATTSIAFDDLMFTVRPQLLFVESGGDNLAAQFEVVRCSSTSPRFMRHRRRRRRQGNRARRARHCSIGSSRHQQDGPRGAGRRQPRCDGARRTRAMRGEGPSSCSLSGHGIGVGVPAIVEQILLGLGAGDQDGSRRAASIIHGEADKFQETGIVTRSGTRPTLTRRIRAEKLNEEFAMRKWTFVVAALFQLVGAGCNKERGGANAGHPRSVHPAAAASAAPAAAPASDTIKVLAYCIPCPARWRSARRPPSRAVTGLMDHRRDRNAALAAFSAKKLGGRRRRPGLQLAPLCGKGARATSEGRSRRRLRLLDVRVAQIRASRFRGAQRPSLLPGSV